MAGVYLSRGKNCARKRADAKAPSGRGGCCLAGSRGLGFNIDVSVAFICFYLFHLLFFFFVSLCFFCFFLFTSLLLLLFLCFFCFFCSSLFLFASLCFFVSIYACLFLIYRRWSKTKSIKRISEPIEDEPIKDIQHFRTIVYLCATGNGEGAWEFLETFNEFVFVEHFTGIFLTFYARVLYRKTFNATAFLKIFNIPEKHWIPLKFWKHLISLKTFNASEIFEKHLMLLIFENIKYLGFLKNIYCFLFF